MNQARPSGRATLLVFTGATLLLAARAALALWRLARADASLPLWDEAAHGFAGVQVADAFRHWSPIELLLALNRQVVWPFVHSLLLAPALLASGNSLAAAEAVSVALFATTIVLLFTAGTLLHPTRGAWVGLAAAALALAAPEWRVFGSLVMLEMPGAVLLMLALLLHARAAREAAGGRWLTAAGIATTALLLCKYNYGLMWLVPLAAWEWRRLPEPARSTARGRVRAWLAAGRWRRPMPLLFGIGALAIAAIVASGGGAFTLAGRQISVRSPGNLAYVLWIVWVAWMLVPRRGASSRAGWLTSRLHPRARILAGSIFVPLAIWFTLPYPNRVRELFGFVANRDSGLPIWTIEGLLYYPRAFAADYSSALWVAIAALLLAVAHVFRRRLDPPARLAALAFAVALAATAIHRYRESRFFFTVAPLLWLCAAHAAVSIADAALRAVPARAIREGAWVALAAVVVAGALLATPRDLDVTHRRAALRAPGALAPAVDAVIDEAVAASRAAPKARVVLLGYSNVLSPGLLGWRARLAQPDWPVERLPKRAPYLPPGADESSLATRLTWLETRADRVIVALADSVGAQAGEYASETWADRESVERMRDDPARWQPGATRIVAGMRIESFRVGTVR